MTMLLWALAVAAMALGLLGVVLPLLPGTPLLFGGMLLAAWLDGFAHVGPGLIALLGALAVAAWLIDYVAAAWGVRRTGASGLAMAGAAIGAVVGVLGGIAGLLLGPVIGAVCGELIARRDHRTATRAGVAAGVAFVVGTVAKLALAIAMLGIFVVAMFGQPG